MAKRKFTPRSIEQSELRVAYDQSKEAILSKKLLAIRLYGNGHKVTEILDATQCSRSSLMGWCRQDRAKGIEGLKDQHPGGNHYRLTSEQKADLADLVKQYSPKQLLGKDYARSIERPPSRALYSRKKAICRFLADVLIES